MTRSTLAWRLSRVALACVLPTLMASAPAVWAQSKPDLRRVHLQCDKAMVLCLLSSPDKDSDGDGFSDGDEAVAGTDPLNPDSKPTVQLMLDLLTVRDLPSFASGRTLLFAPPTHSPDGKALVGLGPLSALAPRFGFPARTAALQRLGIDSSALTAVGIDPTAGFVLSPGAFGGGKGVRIGGTRLPFFASGLRTGLMAAGGDPLSHAGSLGPGQDPNAGKAAVSAGAGKDSGSAVLTFDDGSWSSVASSSQTEGDKTVTGSAVFSFDAKGTLTGASTSTSSTTETVGAKSTKVETSSQTGFSDGTSVSNQITSVALKDDKGNVTSSLSIQVKTETRTDGTTITTTTRENITYNPDGSTTTTVNSSTRTEKGGKVTTTTTPTQTTTTPAGEEPLKPIGCAKSTDTNCTKLNNPEAEYQVVVLTPAQIVRKVQFLQGVKTRQGSTILQYLSPQDVSDPADVAPIAYFDAEGRLLMVAAKPALWNTGAGTERYGSTPVPGAVDPSTLDQPGQAQRDKTQADLLMLELGAITGNGSAGPFPRH